MVAPARSRGLYDGWSIALTVSLATGITITFSTVRLHLT
jgi:hypothetical protein